MEKTLRRALIFNSILFALVAVGAVMCFAEITIIPDKAYEHGIRLLKFFTVQSNLLAGIAALIFIIFLARKHKTQKPVPTWVYVLKLVAAVDLVVTFLVVALFLGFIVPEGYFSLYTNVNFLFHFAIPILNLIGFFWIDKIPKLKFKHTFLGPIHLYCYEIFYLIVVLINWHDDQIDPMFDWYGFAQAGLPLAFVSAFVVFGLGFLISFVLYKINNKINIKQEQKLIQNNALKNNAETETKQSTKLESNAENTQTKQTEKSIIATKQEAKTKPAKQTETSKTTTKKTAKNESSIKPKQATKSTTAKTTKPKQTTNKQQNAKKASSIKPKQTTKTANSTKTTNKKHKTLAKQNSKTKPASKNTKQKKA